MGFRSISNMRLVLRASALAAGLVTVCGVALAMAQELPRHPERGGLGLEFANNGESMPATPGGRVITSFDPRLSIFVTDRRTVGKLSFAEVMDHLVAGSTTARESLFQQWWDTAALKPGLQLGPHCDDQVAPVGDLASFNGFPYRCPRPEAAQAHLPAADPFDPASLNSYIAVAYINRFDLADPLGANCGEYRVIFARKSGETEAFDRNLIIFESLLANPKPADGLAGCRPIQEFWLTLSDPTMNTDQRGDALRAFYLDGLPYDHVGPVIDRRNFAPDTGQIRTNQFLNQSGTFDWTLREFKIVDAAGALVMQPENVKSNPGVELFRAGTTDARAADFIAAVVQQIPALRGNAGGESDIASFSFGNAVLFNSFESDEKIANEGDVLAAFDEQPGGALRQQIQAALTAAGSSLTPDNIVRRLRTQTCAGCHHYGGGDAQLGGGLQWPGTLGRGNNADGFTHVSEREFEDGPDGPGSRFRISDVLTQVLIPPRQAAMLKFLQQFPTP